MSSQNSRVTVAIRMRPGGDEKILGPSTSDSVVSIVDPRSSSSGEGQIEREYGFDQVYSGNATQEHVFKEMCKPLVDHVFEGFNACCFAYGQTGSGKTYSIFGQAGDNRGVIPRAMEYVFDLIEKRKPYAKIATFVSFLEIYMDDIGDLGKFYLDAKRKGRLASDNGPVEYRPPSQTAADPQLSGTRPSSANSGSAAGSRPSSAKSSSTQALAFGGSMPPFFATGGTSIISNSSSSGGGGGNSNFNNSSSSAVFTGSGSSQPRLEIRENANGTVYVKDLSIIPVTGVSEVMEIINRGVAQRATFETQMNAYSSRSHTIFTLTVVQSSRSSSGEVISGMLNLVDLAGSERLKKSESEGQRLKEAVVINKSLSALGNVILGLDSQASYIHYRDSKLTRILQDSLGGNSFTTLLATIFPTSENFDECLATLQFANRCKNVTNHPRVNYVDMGSGQSEDVIRKLQDEIAQLRQSLEMQSDAHEQRLTSLKRSMASMGVDLDTASGILNTTRPADGSLGMGGIGEVGPVPRDKHNKALAALKDGMEKKLEERRKAMAKQHETHLAQTNSYLTEIDALKKKIAALEGNIVAARHSAEVEVENARKAFSEELLKLQRKQHDHVAAAVAAATSASAAPAASGSGAAAASSSRELASGGSSLPVRPMSAKSSRPLSASYSPTRSASSSWAGPLGRDGQMSSSSAISAFGNALSADGDAVHAALAELLQRPDLAEDVKAALCKIDASNSAAMANLKAMYDSFIKTANERILREQNDASLTRRSAAGQVDMLRSSRWKLVELCQMLVDVVESGKGGQLYPKHTGGTGIMLPSLTTDSTSDIEDGLSLDKLDALLKRGKVMRRESLDRSPSPPGHGAGAGAGASSSGSLRASRPWSARSVASSAVGPASGSQRWSPTRDAPAGPLLSAPRASQHGRYPSAISVVSSSAGGFGRTDSVFSFDVDIERMDVSDLRDLIYSMKRQFTSLGMSPAAHSVSAASTRGLLTAASPFHNPPPGLAAHQSRRPDAGAVNFSEWKVYAEAVEQERDAYKRALGVEKKKIHQLRVSFESLKRTSSSSSK